MNKPIASALSLLLTAVLATGCAEKPAEDSHDHDSHSESEEHADHDKHSDHREGDKHEEHGDHKDEPGRNSATAEGAQK